MKKVTARLFSVIILTPIHTCVYSFISAHAHIYAYTLLTRLFVCFCNFSVLSCFIRPATWQEERVERQAKKKDLAELQVPFFFSHSRQPSLAPPLHTHTHTHPPASTVISSGHTLAKAGPALVQAVEGQTRKYPAWHLRKIDIFIQMFKEVLHNWFELP